MEIFWSKRAISSLDKIRFYIRKHFTVKEENEFIERVLETIQTVKNSPKSFPETKQIKQTRKATIHPHSALFYRVKSKTE